jgi:TolB protein
MPIVVQVKGERPMTRSVSSRIMAAVVAALVAGTGFYLLWSAFRGGPAGQSLQEQSEIGRTRVVYSVLEGTGNTDNSEIYAVGDSGTARVSDFAGPDLLPDLSPDGSSILFVSARDDADNVDVYVMSVDGTEVRRLTTSKEVDTGPRWSPDGSKVVFQRSDGEGHWEIFVVNADGSGEERLTSNEVSDESPAWSPDGKLIAFERYVGSNLEVFTMKADGSSQARLTDLPGEDGEPQWSPDGGSIAFVRDDGETGETDIYVVDSDGTNVRRLTAGAAIDTDPQWLPDESIFFLREAVGDSGAVAMTVSANGDESTYPIGSAFLTAAEDASDILGVDVG